jgi:hypothetical protein
MDWEHSRGCAGLRAGGPSPGSMRSALIETRGCAALTARRRREEEARPVGRDWAEAGSRDEVRTTGGPP